MEMLKVMERGRKPVRRELDKLKEELESLLNEEKLDEDLINIKFKLFLNAFEQLQQHDWEIASHIRDHEEIDENVGNQEFDEVYSYKEKVETLKTFKEKRMPTVSSVTTESVSGVTNEAEMKMPNIKLPPMQIKKFGGNLKDWLGWWSQFKSIDGNENISNKFGYLLQFLEEGSDAYEIANAFPHSDEYYPRAVEALKKRFGDEGLLLNVYLRELLDLVISTAQNNGNASLKTLFSKVSGNLRALQSLNLEKADPTSWLVPLVESSMPERIRYGWQRDALSSYDGSRDNPPRTKLDLLMSYVEKEVEIQQRVEISRSFMKRDKGEKTDRKDNAFNNYVRQKGTFDKKKASTLSSFHLGEQRKCVFCDFRNNHESKDCNRAKRMKHEEKIKILKAKGLCYNCTGNHLGKECITKNLDCELCHRRHFTVLCKEADGGKGKVAEQPPAKRVKLDNEMGAMTSSNIECTPEVALQTVMVKLVNGNKEACVRAFIDSGSQRSYILQSTADALQLEPVGVENVVHSLFGNKQTDRVTHVKYEIVLEALDGSFQKKFEVQGNNKLCGAIPRVAERSRTIRRELQDRGIQLNDTSRYQGEVGILIGADIYSKLLTGEIVDLNCGPIAINTKLGWTIMGDTKASTYEDSTANLTVTMATMNGNISQLWSLEAIGIYDQPDNKKEEEAKFLQKFQECIQRDSDGRYCVAMPWKEKVILLPPNREVALKRLQSATDKLLKNDLFDVYHNIFMDWEKEGFIERVGPSERVARVHYLPHRPVIKPESITTPVRPVFDASCRTGRHPSLNECLYTGDNMIRLIPEILLRFREKPIGFVADIRKTFQMISVAKGDRDLMRFLWWQDKGMTETIEFRHVRVMFGATCSPFILGAVLHSHLTSIQGPGEEIGKRLLSSLYVDNCFYSVETYGEYAYFREQAVELLSRAKMDLRMWLSNVDALTDNGVISVLGMMWDRNRDELFVNGAGENTPDKISKRALLSIIHKYFDPLGIICPALLPMKIILQKSWNFKLKWDEQMGDDDVNAFLKWHKQAKQLTEIRVPRVMSGGRGGNQGWSLHTFVDACKYAYAAVVFLRDQREEYVTVQLVMAKSRLAPNKQMTIPKLELMGCLIGMRLVNCIKRALQNEGIPCTFWTDSSTALAWIQRDDNWGTFVGNRTSEIRKHTTADQWRHVPGHLNPADLPSRGCSPEQLLESKWWEGPSWLYQNEGVWPMNAYETNEEEIYTEVKKGENKRVSFSFLDHVKKQHKFSTLVRIMSWVRRFLYNYQVIDVNKRRVGILTNEELRRAELIVTRDIQQECFTYEEAVKRTGLELFLDEWNVIRVKTRLTYREDPVDFKYPILLPSNRAEVAQLIMEAHVKYFHAGTGFMLTILRNKYWIIRARKTVKGVISKCVNCRRFKAKECIPKPAPLPLDRVKNAEVFEVVGIDLAGPLILKNGKKAWMVIYTCAIYRAVHFELVGALTSKAFIKSLERFVKKYRRPAIIYSDNGTNFRGAQRLFKTLDWDRIIRDENALPIEWKFIPVTSAWWGGIWERLIRTAKDLLTRTLRGSSLTWHELEVAIGTVAEVMNERPLTYVSEDPADLEPLKPSLFLHPLGNVNFPECILTEGDKLRVRHKHMMALKTELRNRFVKEYLALLVNQRPKKATRELRIGELVLVGSDNKKRILWPLARVLELIRGPDGICRLAKVKTADGEFVRTVQRLFPLEIDVQDPVGVCIQEKVVRTRSGRKVKKPSKYC